MTLKIIVLILVALVAFKVVKNAVKVIIGIVLLEGILYYFNIL